MSDSFAQHVKQFNAIVQNSEVLLSIVRDSGLQREAIARLGTLLNMLGTWKEDAIESKDEECANIILGMECVTESIKAELGCGCY
jgi:hypothetical protein